MMITSFSFFQYNISFQSIQSIFNDFILSIKFQYSINYLSNQGFFILNNFLYDEIILTSLYILVFYLLYFIK